MTSSSPAVPRPTSEPTGAADRSHPVLSSVAGEALAADAAVVAAARRRIRESIGADRGSSLLTGGSFLLAVVLWLLVAPPPAMSVTAFGACVVVYAIAGSVEFEIGPGCALPTMPVQVIMLFLLPPQVVPVAVLLGLAGAAGVARLRDPARREQPLVLAASGWQVMGPALVFAAAHIHHASGSDWPVYVLALLAQFGCDATTSWVRNCYGLGVPTTTLVAALRFTFLCDLSLAPVGLAAALAVPASATAFAFLLPLTLLFAVMQSDRAQQLDQTVALATAFSDTSRIARHDALTGVSNRLAFEEATAALKTSSSPIGVVLADVDGLKVANDTFGHASGDQLLVAIAGRIGHVLAATTDAPVFRIGGDEFAILLPAVSASAIDALTTALRDAFAHTPPLEGRVVVSASVGSAYAPAGPMLGQAIAAADRGVNEEKTRRGRRRQ